MKKLFAVIAVVVAAAAAYYYFSGSQKLVEALKARVDTQLQVLQRNGFLIEERKVENRREHFVINYADPDKIAHYLRSKHIDITDQDAWSLKGLRVGVDLEYLKGTYSALSADLYPISFPPELVRMETEQGHRTLVRIAKEKIFLAHIDINKLFNAYRGHLKDINATFKDVETLTVLSQGFAFEGRFNEEVLKSSRNRIGKLQVRDGHGAGFAVEKLEGSYELKGKTLYDFDSHYRLGSLSLQDGRGERIGLTGVTIDSSGTSDAKFASSALSFHIESLDMVEPRGKHYFEAIDGKFRLEKLSIAALEKMQKLDANDTAGLNEAFKSLLSQGITLKMEEFSAKKMRNRYGKMVDGFRATAAVSIDKVTDFDRLRQNPFVLLSLIDASMHIELSDAVYLALIERPEFAILTLLFSPASKEGKKIFDIRYAHDSLSINGQKLF